MIAWLKRRRAQKREEAYRRGFAWVMTAYYLERMTLEEIDDYLGHSDLAPGPLCRAFDEGGIEAQRILASIDAVLTRLNK